MTKIIAELCGVPQAEVVTARSAAAAFLGFLLSLDLDSEAEVLLPVSLCQTMVNAVLLAGATPVLADCGDAFELEPASAASRLTWQTRVVVFHHPFGRACDLAPLSALLADRPDVLLVEDCAQAPGTALEGRSSGSSGDVALFSFGPGKPIDAGVGGAIVGTGDRIDQVRLALRTGRHGWPDDVVLGVDSTLTTAEERVVAEAVAAFPTTIRNRIAKVRAALGLPPAPPGPPSDVYHRLVLDVGDPVRAEIHPRDAELWQTPCPANPPYAVPFLQRRYAALGRSDLWDPAGDAFPVWRGMVTRRILVRTGEDVPQARLVTFCRQLGFRR